MSQALTDSGRGSRPGSCEIWGNGLHGTGARASELSPGIAIALRPVASIRQTVSIHSSIRCIKRYAGGREAEGGSIARVGGRRAEVDPVAELGIEHPPNQPALSLRKKNAVGGFFGENVREDVRLIVGVGVEGPYSEVQTACVVCVDCLLGIEDTRGRGSLPNGDNIKLQRRFQSPKDKDCCRTDDSEIQQQSSLPNIFELQSNFLRAYCFQIDPLRVRASR